MMNGEETDGGISLGDMEKALVCLLMTSMEAPVQAESAGLTQEMFADASLGFVYEVIMKIYATGVRPDMVLVERGMREADEELAAKLGGLSFLLPYMLNVRHDGNVAAYVEGIKKQYKLRCLVTLFGTMAFKAGKVSSVPEELVDEAERLLMQFRQKTAEGAPVRTIGELAAEAVSWHYRRFGGELEAEQVKIDEATAQIAGFAKAVELRLADYDAKLAHMAGLKAYCREKLLAMGGVVPVGEGTAPHILAVSLVGYPSANIVTDLGAQGICISAGSACHQGKASHVVSALGLDKKTAAGVIRISFSPDNTREDVDVLCQALLAHRDSRFPML